MSPLLPLHRLKTRVRRLTLACLALWLAATLAPVIAARYPGLILWGWPLDFWMAAQGCVLVYLVLVAYYAWQVNRWEKQAGESSIEVPPGQWVD